MMLELDNHEYTVEAVARLSEQQGISLEDARALLSACLPLWGALGSLGFTDAPGGMEFLRTAVEAVDFIRTTSNLGPYQHVEVSIVESVVS